MKSVKIDYYGMCKSFLGISWYLCIAKVLYMATLGIDWWCFVFCFLFSILIGGCRSHDQMPTSHCFAWQWASVAVSITHSNYLRKVLAFFDFSVYSYHFSDIMSFQIKMWHVFTYWFCLVNQPFHTCNLNSFLSGNLP